MGKNGKSARRGKKETLAVEEAVRKAYSLGAKERLEGLCCPVSYDPRYLDASPKEILERDYGCGDPSRHVREGDTVLDLGSGAGKICFIAAQMVGPRGRVIGVDFNDAMLALARKHVRSFGDRIGCHNVEFHKGKIQDLRPDLDRLDEYLRAHPVRSAEDWLALESYRDQLAESHPLIPDESIDVVISNCVLNLVRERDKERLFREMFRCLKRGGRVAISDIVSDEDVPGRLKNDPELWSGCISGAFREDLFLEAFEDAGFYAVKIEDLAREPFRAVQGIQFRSVTVTAFKGKQGPCLERNQAVIYKGPWKEVLDDDGHLLKRGRRMAVCDKTYHLYGKPPYKDDIILVPPIKEIPLDRAGAFDCSRPLLRHPRETKGARYKKTYAAGTGASCTPGGSCC